MTVMDFPNAPVDGQTTTDGRYYFDSTVGSSGAWRSAPLPVGGLPAGSIIQWGATSPPANWLLCDGSQVSRTTYSSLFAAIGTTYGVGNGTTTFNLPNLRGRVGVGRDGSQTEFDTLGESGGAKTHTLSINQIPAHTHGGVSSTYSNSGTTASSINRDAGGTNNVSSASTGGGQAHNNLQPYLVTNYIIKATAGWTAGDSELATRLGALEASTPNASNLTSGTLSTARLPSGTVLQVVTGTTSSMFSSTTLNTWLDASLSATITPKSTSSKIHIFCNAVFATYRASGAAWQTIFRGSTNLGDASNGISSLYSDVTGTVVLVVPGMIYISDSPNTTSATTYSLRVKFGQNGGQSGETGQPRTITLMEVAG